MLNIEISGNVVIIDKESEMMAKEYSTLIKQNNPELGARVEAEFVEGYLDAMEAAMKGELEMTLTRGVKSNPEI